MSNHDYDEQISERTSQVEWIPVVRLRNMADHIREGYVLLIALRNVIMPLVGDGGDVPFGPEGKDLLNALQKFISRIARGSTPQEQELIAERQRKENFSTDLGKHSQDDSYLNAAQEDNEDSSDNENPQDFRASVSLTVGSSTTRWESTPLDKALTELRLHVFNKMPIRLLRFKRRASKTTITLIERGQIYYYLSRKIRAQFDDKQFASEIASTIKFGADKMWAEQTVIKNWVSRVARYAILSHTWLRGSSGEVTFEDWREGTYKIEQQGYQKLLKFCETAAEDHGLTLGWIDTVCINKDSSSELDESIRSMYQWYRDSRICITYLANTWGLAHMHQDPWFTRGWTLQELLAPPRIKFYDADWKKLVENHSDDKADHNIRASITAATTITATELYTVHNLSISRKMQLAARREVTREEDRAYCLMGIFGVSISIAYGEGGKRAFFRLVQEILNSTRNALDIFNWAGSGGSKLVSSLIPPGPASYLHRYSNPESELVFRPPLQPLTLTHLGLRIQILLIPGVPNPMPMQAKGPTSFLPIGDYYGTIRITPIAKHGHPIFLAESPTPDSITFPSVYNLLDARVNTPQGRVDGRIDGPHPQKIVFGVVNFEMSSGNTIYIPGHCLAIAFLHHAEVPLEDLMAAGSLLRVETQKPIVFQLKKKFWRDEYPLLVGHTIDKSRVEHHGMRLLTAYL